MEGLKNVIFCACLLSVLCASNADAPVPNPIAPVPAVDVKNATILPANSTLTPATNASKVDPAEVLPGDKNTATVMPPVPAAPNKTENGSMVVPPASPKNATTNSTEIIGNKTTLVPTDSTVTPAPVAPAAKTNTTVVPSNSTAVPQVANVTAAPIADKTVVPAAAPVHVNPGRYFDGLSFIGGMVLAVGLLGIGRVAFKIYKNRSDGPNYLTL